MQAMTFECPGRVRGIQEITKDEWKEGKKVEVVTGVRVFVATEGACPSFWFPVGAVLPERDQEVVVSGIVEERYEATVREYTQKDGSTRQTAYANPSYRLLARGWRPQSSGSFPAPKDVSPSSSLKIEKKQ